MSVLGTTALSHACGTQAAFTELSISKTCFSKREVDIASPRRSLQIQVDGLSPTLPIAGSYPLRFNANAVVHGSANPLFAAEVTFGYLHRNVSEEELNLLQLPACKNGRASHT